MAVEFLCEDGRIKAGFWILSGARKEAVKEIINQPTLTGGRKKIDGRQFLIKAKSAIKESKILLAYWADYTKNGGFLSGKNEEDALLFCTESVSTENSRNLEKEEDTEDDEEEEDRPISQSRVLTQPLVRRVVDSDNDEEEAEDEGESDDEGEIEHIS